MARATIMISPIKIICNIYNFQLSDKRKEAKKIGKLPIDEDKDIELVTIEILEDTKYF